VILKKQSMNKLLAFASLAIAVASVSTSAAAQGRDTINIVGSSTVYPFTTVVAERFGKSSGMKTPKVESTGTGGGMKLFCAGMALDTADFTNASRRMKKSEQEKCAENGVKEVVEMPIGYDGLTVAQAKGAAPMNLTREEIYLALAKQIPSPTGEEVLIDNPNKTWKDVNKSLPDVKIEVIGPPPSSGTRDSFVELTLEHGCKEYAWLGNLEKIDKDDYAKKCKSIREDGAFIEAGENDNLIVQKLNANKFAVGVFGYSFLEENLDKVQAVSIEGVKPTPETVGSGEYKISRPMFVYMKKGHIGSVPGMHEFAKEYMSDKSMGEDGYLVEKGMIPLAKELGDKARADVDALTVMDAI
jgi:phosphate transport system substrate-binding protein